MNPLPEDEILKIKARLTNGGALNEKDRRFISANYEAVMGKKFTRTGCSSCYKDAFIELYTKLNINMQEGKNKQYAFKNGVVMHTAGDVYTNANLTDEIAVQLLLEKPERENLFSALPKNWQNEVKKAQAEKEKQEKEALEKEKAASVAKDSADKKPSEAKTAEDQTKKAQAEKETK